ncbi:MAG: hypothetical protein O2930_14875 [Acidobacteria bacterium]|nr:hypothetical protein [Acidobacteriota bacterium]
MMTGIHALRSCSLGLAGAVLIAGAAAAQEAGPTTRMVYVSASDGEGEPVTDLTAADFRVREDGEDREVVRAELATEPMRVGIVVDDNGGGFFQNGIIQLLTGLDGRAEFAVIAVNGSPTWVVDYTSEFGALQGALSGVGRRAGRPGDGQVMEALMDLGQRLQERRVARPVVVVFTVGGGSTSIRASDVRNRLKPSGVLLHVVGTNLARDMAPIYTGRVDDADLQMNIMFDDGVTDTGGRVQEFTVAEGIESAAERIVDELLNQYVVSYTLPPGVEPHERLNVSVMRRGVSLRAPQRIPVN